MGVTKFINGSILFVQLYNGKVLIGSCVDQPLRFYDDTGLAVDIFNDIRINNVVEIVLSTPEGNETTREVQFAFVTTGPFNPPIIPSLTIPREQIFTVSTRQDDIVNKYVEFISKETIKAQQCVCTTGEDQSAVKQ